MSVASFWEGKLNEKAHHQAGVAAARLGNNLVADLVPHGSASNGEDTMATSRVGGEEGA